MTWYQDGPAIYRDVDVCRPMRGRYWDCGDENRCGAPTLPWWKGDCFDTAPWGQPLVWYARDAVARYTFGMFVAEFYNTCADGPPDDLYWLNCHAPPTIPGREVVYAEERV